MIGSAIPVKFAKDVQAGEMLHKIDGNHLSVIDIKVTGMWTVIDLKDNITGKRYRERFSSIEMLKVAA